MTITTDQAIALAQKVGALMIKDGHSMTPTFTVGLSHKKLTALCNKVREQTLLEAADQVRFDDDGTESARNLRRMAEEE